MAQRAHAMGLYWKIYFFVFAVVAAGTIIGITSPDAKAYGYYHVLMAFHSRYALSYALAVASAVTNLVALVPVYLYAFRIRFLAPRLWQWVFVLRIGCNLIGHSYEVKHLQALFRADPLIAISALFLTAVAVIPSHWACFQYSFRQKKVFAQPSEK